jgi:hypothetical protein
MFMDDDKIDFRVPKLRLTLASEAFSSKTPVATKDRKDSRYTLGLA